MRHSPPSRAERPYACTATIRAEGWSVPQGQLWNFDALAFKQQFRGHLNRVMAEMGGNPGGCLMAGLHGAYDPTTDSFPLHYHLIVTGVMIDVVAGLRDLRMYAPAQPYDGRDAAIHPIRISSKPLSNMPEPLTYVLQRWWPLRETYLGEDGIRRAYGGMRRGIRGAPEAEYLMFLDRCRLEDLVLLMNMHVAATGLVAR
jgi:hypothetical protein